MAEDKRAAAEFGCDYIVAWVGNCNAPKGESGFCARHTGTKCRACGEQATHDCSYAGQFVCGAPLCRNCEGWEDRTKASGAWGFLNHSHRVKPSVQAERDRREAVAADFGLLAASTASPTDG